MTENRHETGTEVIALPYQPLRKAADLQFLRDVREVLKDRQHWCQRSLAYDVRGEAIGPTNYAAFQWCLIGAARKVIGDVVHYEVSDKALNAFAEDLGFESPDSVATFNDTVGHGEVIDLLDKRIAYLERLVRGAL